MVQVKEFAVEQWMDKYEHSAKYNIAETCCASISLKDLQELSEDKSLSPLDLATKLTYGAIRGSERLRGTLANLYSVKTPTPLPSDHVLITPGAIQANFLLLYSLVGPGDHVICHYPTYQQLYSVPTSLGAEVSLWKSKENNGWKLDVDELKQMIRPNTKLIILNNPQNPTGAVIPQATLEEIVEIARSSSIFIHADEVYRPIFHSINPMEPDFPSSILSLGYDRTIATGSMSKAYSLAGIRVGWIASRDRSVIETCAAARHYTTISVSQLDDAIASYALDASCIHNLLKRNIQLAKTNLAILEKFIESYRWACEWVKPRAGTTAFVRFSKMGKPVNDVAFCEMLLDRTGVMFVPGSQCFGEGEDFRGYVRIGVVQETHVLEEGLEALTKFMEDGYEEVPVFSLFYDVTLIGGLTKAILRSRLALRRDHLNFFYILEQYALAPATKNNQFIVYNGRVWTFYETYLMALRYGAWFKKVHGVQPKEIVAMDFMNSSTFVFLLLGLWSIGAIPAFINYNLAGKPLTHCIRTSTARLLVVDDEIRQQFTPEQKETLASPEFHENGGSVDVVFFTPEVEAQIMQMEATREDDSVRGGSALRDLAMLIYTSGTTGLPKPAIVSWKKCWNGAVFVTNWLGLTKDDRFFTCMPLYHSSAAILGFATCLMSGSTLIIGRKFSARNFWKEARENNATIVQYVGETLRYLMAIPPEIDAVSGEDLDKKHNVRAVFGNGLRPDIWARFKERFNVPTVAEFYSATEGTSGSWNLSSNDFTTGAIGRNGSLSRLILGGGLTVVQIDHETQQPWRDPQTGFCKAVPRGDPGELLYAINPADPAESFQGYFKNSNATESKIVRDVFRKGDAYFRSGDIVRWDTEGRWYFNDRLGDTFRWKSENVSTSEVAEVLGTHPDVHEANVYGVALPNHDGRAGCAAIILKQQHQAADPSVLVHPTQEILSSLAAHVLKNLPRFAVPLFLRFAPEMQGTGNNKQQKHVLRTEGVDPSLVNSSDKLYWLQGDKYEPFEQKDWSRLQGGQVKL
ncbi:long-chain fatty acid transporter [Aspergillus alliaceus]|uniref:Very long-chain fatty acid transport protein n=1 Tax=Petromyces alliaceus TaxID=209559 RepID=A0A5N7CJI9_PETAA|nr:long-chain fatty acid transporter [Aspergillus alliaceus]